MSINIQLDGKLQKISGQTMTKEKIVEKLGYTPANEATVNTSITNLESNVAADIAAVNADLSDLKAALENYIKDHPDIVEDGSGEVVFTDEAGNIIAKLDADGLHTTNVEADSFISNGDNLIINDLDGNKIFQVDKNGVETTKLKLASGDVDEQLDSLAADIAAVEAKIPEIPVTSVNGKTGDVELEYSDLKNAPAIEAEENEKSLIITDNSGNIALRAGDLDEGVIGIETLEVVLPGGKVDERINDLSANLASHKCNTTNHITAAERNTWNRKSDFSGEFKDLLNSPITEDNSGELVYTDEAGNIALKIGKLDEATAGLETVEIKLKGGKVDERLNKLNADLAAHAGNTETHITSAERQKWNNKSNVKSYYDLPDAPDISSDEDNSLLIADKAGNIVFKAGNLAEDDNTVTGVETTLIKAKEADIENVYTKEEVDAAVATKSDISHGHTISAGATGDDAITIKGTAGTNGVSYEVSHTKATEAGTYRSVTVNEFGHVTKGTNPTTLSGYKISDAYTKDEIDSKLATKANDGHDHDDRYYTEEEVDNKIAAAVTSALKYKGTKNTTSDLPTSGNTTGDVWNIATACAASGSLPKVNAGDNVAWNGTSWDVLAGTVDLSSYYTKSTVDAKLAAERAYIDSEDIFETDIATVNALGGIAAGTNLNGLTTHEVLKKLLYPYVQPTVGSATASPNGGTYECGVTKTITQVSVSVTKKSELITSVALYNGATLIEEKTGDAVKNGGTITFTGLNVVVPTNGNQLTVKVTDAKGTVQEKNTTAMTFVYPYYIGTCSAGVTINGTLVKNGLSKKVEAKGNKSNSFTVSNGHMVFAYPKAYGVLSSILDPNNFETINGYSRSEVNITGLDGTAQAYYVYVSGATTVSNFTVNFKY